MTVADFILVSTPISSPKLSIFKLPPGMRIPLFSIPILAYAMAFLFESLIDPFKMIFCKFLK